MPQCSGMSLGASCDIPHSMLRRHEGSRNEDNESEDKRKKCDREKCRDAERCPRAYVVRRHERGENDKEDRHRKEHKRHAPRHALHVETILRPLVKLHPYFGVVLGWPSTRECHLSECEDVRGEGHVPEGDTAWLG